MISNAFRLGWQWGQHHRREATDQEAIALVGYDDAAHFCQGSIDGSEGDRWRLEQAGKAEGSRK